jgi:hypothetical protein
VHDLSAEEELSKIVSAEMLEDMNKQIKMSYNIIKQGIAGSFSLGMKLYPNMTMKELEDKGFHP